MNELQKPSADENQKPRIPVVFGLGPTLPLRGFPKGKKIIRQRRNEFVVVTVKRRGGVRVFFVTSDGFAWRPAFEKGVGRVQTHPRDAGKSTGTQNVQN